MCTCTLQMLINPVSRVVDVVTCTNIMKLSHLVEPFNDNCLLPDPLQRYGASREAAKEQFESLYLDKTGNSWSERNDFVKRPGKFYPLEIDYGQDTSDTASLPQLTGSRSKLAPEIQDLIRTIFDVETMKKAMAEFEVRTRGVGAAGTLLLCLPYCRLI